MRPVNECAVNRLSRWLDQIVCHLDVSVDYNALCSYQGL